MLAPTVLRKDESTQTTPPPEIAPAKKHDVASQSPAPSLLGLEHQSTDVRKTSVDQTAGSAGPGIEPSPLEIPLLGPVPKGFGQAYDYLGKVKELADNIRPDLYETCFEQRFAQSSSRFIFYALGGNTENHGSWDSESPEIYEHVSFLRENFQSTRKPGHTALLVEAINKAGVQAIGMALDVNPFFFARHLSAMDESHHLTNDMVTLGEMFETHVMSQRAFGESQHYRAMGGSNYSWADSRVTAEKGSPGSLGQTPWSSDDFCRITIGNENMQYHSRTSDAQSSWNSCNYHDSRSISYKTADTRFSGMILVDSPVSLHRNEHGPSNQGNMLNLFCYHLPGRLSPGEPGHWRCNFFDDINVILGHQPPALRDPENMLEILIGYIILNSW